MLSGGRKVDGIRRRTVVVRRKWRKRATVTCRRRTKIVKINQTSPDGSGVEVGSACPVIPAFVDHGERTQGPWNRVPFVNEINGYHHPTRRIPVSCLGALALFERSARSAPWPTGGRPTAIDTEKRSAIVVALEGGATKAAVCLTFGLKRSRLIDSLARIGWSAGIEGQEDASDTTAAIGRSPDRRAVRSSHGSA